MMNNAFGMSGVITEEMVKNLITVEYVHKSLEIAKIYLDNGLIDREEYLQNLKRSTKMFEV